MQKVKLNLFNLKSKEDLISVNNLFKSITSKWFNFDKSPNDKFFKLRNCPLCTSSESKKIFEIDNFTYHKCLNCDSIYTKPFLKDEVLEELYTHGEYSVYQDKLVQTGRKIRKGTLDERKFSQIDTILKKENPSILDVGCGSGTFLDVCKGNSWDVEGVDMSSIAVSNALLNYQIKVHEGDFNLLNLTKKYDAITFWGVLEHLPEPIIAIKMAKKLLKKDGLIVFEVPSANCFLKEYLEKNSFSPTRYIESGRHNIFFSKKVLEIIAHNFGLQIELIESNGLDIQTILLEEFDDNMTDKILNIQDTLNDMLLGDHLRVFLRNSSKTSIT
jgi:2-polyprenyl-3-methyl-5-hydroxy-6-metoxy-1,4-benzoquinol methylase